jgi:hypothetical protein
MLFGFMPMSVVVAFGLTWLLATIYDTHQARKREKQEMRQLLRERKWRDENGFNKVHQSW